MKPNFALTLSFEGIRLLHRSSSGWTMVGEVPLDERDLAGGLAAMRATAAALEPGGVRTKVMLPPEQVRLLDASAPGEAAAREALGAALGDAAGEHVIDHAVVGDRARVAAVPREVLEEAEAFVKEHRFHPVCFAAVLPDGVFPGEAFFGETRLAQGGPERVERDAEATAPQARRGAAPARAEGSAGAPAALAVEDRTGGEAAAARPLGEAVPPATDEPAVAADLGDERPGSGPGTPGAEAAPTGLKGSDGAAEPRPPEPVAPTSAANSGDAQEATVAEVVPDPAPGPVEALLEAPLSATGIPEPLFASRARVLPEPRGAAGGSAPLRAPARPPAQGLALPPRRPTGDARASARPEPAVQRTARGAEPARALQPPPVVRPTAAVATAAPPPAARTPAPPSPEPARARGKPRFLGVILTAALVLTMLAVGVWASSTGRDIAGLLGLRDAPEVAAAPAHSPEPAPETPATLAAAAPPAAVAAPDAADAAEAAAAVAAAIEALPEPEPTPAAAPGTPVSPAEAEEVYAATGVWLRAPSLLDLPGGDASPPEVAPAPEAALPAVAPPSPLVPATADAEPPASPQPSVPGTAAPVAVAAAEPAAAPAARPAESLVNAMAEAPGLRPALRPAEPTLPAAMLAAAAPPPALPPATGAPLGQPSAVPGGIAAAALGQVEGQLGAPLGAPPRALAFAGTEGAATTGAAGAVGLAAFDGSRPPARPEDLAPEAAVTVLASYDGPRPGPRPEGLAPEEPAGDAVAEADPSAAALADAASIEAAVAAAQAAGVAPPGAPPEVTPEVPAPDVQSTLAAIVAGGPDPLAGATRQAVAVARLPDARPRNFGSVVQDQLARSARAAQPAAAQGGSPEDVEAGDPEVASAAAAAPSGPTTQSVAQAATFADVMALREVNLIGVFGQPSDRRALVRMGNGRYLRVGVGDSLDGGQVTAIGDNALNYTKRGRQVQLVIPGG